MVRLVFSGFSVSMSRDSSSPKECVSNVSASSENEVDDSPFFEEYFVKNLRLLGEYIEEWVGVGFTKGRLNTIGSHSLTHVRTSRFVFFF